MESYQQRVVLTQTLQEMNWSFGRGEIASVSINLDKSRPDDWCGTVIRRFPGGMVDDVRLWKSDGRTITFLSHKRVLPPS